MTDLSPLFSPDCHWAAVVEPDDAQADFAKRRDRLYLVSDPAFTDADWLEENAKGDSATAKIADPNGLPTRAVKAYETAGALGDLAWSPDNQWLAFTTEERTKSPDDSKAELWLLNLRTKQARLLLTGGAEPAWQGTASPSQVTAALPANP